MLSDYIRAAMKKAKYERLEDGSYFGRIPGIRGVWANEETEATCREELRNALEDWLIFSIRHGYRIPTIAGINLNAPVTTS
ncbi:MAG: type II toxin-antitoxin system HicB family antitoxin [Chloroflexi bacterium]|nr:type II toxin-antitoxin system HicB family antitoxin [Chloroflexota bacterium]